MLDSISERLHAEREIESAIAELTERIGHTELDAAKQLRPLAQQLELLDATVRDLVTSRRHADEAMAAESSRLKSETAVFDLQVRSNVPSNVRSNVRR